MARQFHKGTSDQATTDPSSVPVIRSSENDHVVVMQSEASWQRAPSPVVRPDGRPSRISLARWTKSVLREPMEVSADHVDDSHFVTYSLRAADVDFTIGSTPVTNGLVRPNRILLQGPTWQKRRSLYRDSFDFFRIYFRQTLLVECLEAVDLPPSSSEIVLFDANFVEDRWLDDLIRALVNVDNEGGPFGPAFVDGIGLALASRLVQQHWLKRSIPSPRAATPLAKWRMRRVVDYIEAHLSEPIYLAELSGVAGLSGPHFAAQFRAAVGVPPYAYILERRIACAKEMLRTRGTSAAAVAQKVGFSSPAHFASAFKKVMGITAGKWQRDAWQL